VAVCGRDVAAFLTWSVRRSRGGRADVGWGKVGQMPGFPATDTRQIGNRSVQSERTAGRAVREGYGRAVQVGELATATQPAHTVAMAQDWRTPGGTGSTLVQRAAVAQRPGVPSAHRLLPRQPRGEIRRTAAETGRGPAPPTREEPTTSAAHPAVYQRGNRCLVQVRSCAKSVETKHCSASRKRESPVASVPRRGKPSGKSVWAARTEPPPCWLKTGCIVWPKTARPP
jgi:hypothetical protein